MEGRVDLPRRVANELADPRQPCTVESVSKNWFERCANASAPLTPPILMLLGLHEDSKPPCGLT